MGTLSLHNIESQPVIDTAPLIAEITAAFDGVAREDGVSLRESRMIDNYGCDEERAEARRLDIDTRWRDVSNADLRDYYYALHYLDAKGFRYYLPAYLIWDLRENTSPEHGIVSDTLWHLHPPDDDSQLERFRLITPQQGRAVCSFLRFVAIHGSEGEREEAAGHLSDYWSRYCNNDAE